MYDPRGMCRRQKRRAAVSLQLIIVSLRHACPWACVIPLNETATLPCIDHPCFASTRRGRRIPCGWRRHSPWSRGGMDVTTYAVVGTPVTREDGPEKVSGKTCYAGDLRLPGMLWGKVLRSPLPHARIVRIDTSGALQLPGVQAVLTGHDVAGRLVGRTLRDVPLLAQEKVRFVGEKVAAVVADDVDTAEEALTQIEVEYDELPAIFDPVQAMQPEAPVVHDGAPSYYGPPVPVQPRFNISQHQSLPGGD